MTRNGCLRAASREQRPSTPPTAVSSGSPTTSSPCCGLRWPFWLSCGSCSFGCRWLVSAYPLARLWRHAEREEKFEDIGTVSNWRKYGRQRKRIQNGVGGPETLRRTHLLTRKYPYNSNRNGPDHHQLAGLLAVRQVQSSFQYRGKRLFYVRTGGQHRQWHGGQVLQPWLDLYKFQRKQKTNANSPTP